MKGQIGQQTYGSFSKRIHGRILDGKSIPIDGTMELTARCNMRCIHCYINEPDNAVIRRKELTTGRIQAIVDQLHEYGCLWLLLTGGEPLLREDFSEIYLYVKKKGFLITVFTNGTKITPEIAALFAEYPPFSVEISIYGATEHTHELVTKSKGSYERCLNGINHLLKRKIPLQLKTCALNVNKHELAAMEHFAKKLGVRFRYDEVINPRINGDMSRLRYRLDPEEIIGFDLENPKRTIELQKLCMKKTEQQSKQDYLFRCGAGLNSFHIDPYGNMSPCIMTRYLGHDLKKENFKRVWDAFLPEVREKKYISQVECRRCTLYKMCGICPGIARIETGNPEQKVDFLCRLARLRSKTIFNTTRKKCYEKSCKRKETV